MEKIEIDGRLQVSAGLALLENSRLLSWDESNHKFRPVPKETFENSWKTDVDPVFGRLMCWISFSAGAEFFLKGVCLLYEIDFRAPKNVPKYPYGDLDVWITRYLESPKATDMNTSVTNFKALGQLTHSNGGLSLIEQLCLKANATRHDANLVAASFDLLRDSIRNRDAHAYVPNVRDAHHHLVPKLFSQCLNLLASWVPGGAKKLTEWKHQAGLFIDQIS